jgi:hypothetical protein
MCDDTRSTSNIEFMRRRLILFGAVVLLIGATAIRFRYAWSPSDPPIRGKPAETLPRALDAIGVLAGLASAIMLGLEWRRARASVFLVGIVLALLVCFWDLLILV